MRVKREKGMEASAQALRHERTFYTRAQTIELYFFACRAYSSQGIRLYSCTIALTFLVNFCEFCDHFRPDISEHLPEVERDI